MVDRRRAERDIEALRESIDRLDEKLLHLLFERAGLVREVSEIKRLIGVPCIDEGREREILDRLLARNSGRLPVEDLMPLLEALRRLMRHQTELGPPGPSGR